MLLSCNDNQGIVEPEDNVYSSQHRTNEEIIQIACKTASLFNPKSRTAPSLSKIVVVKSNNSRGSLSDTLLYAVNYENKQGFVLIPSDRRREPFIGYVESGSYSNEILATNPSFEYYIENTLNYLSGIGNFSGDTILPPPIQDLYDPWTITLLYDITPRICVRWGNNVPEGIYCPNGVAGCNQVAMAQICSYFEAPSRIDFTYPEKEVTSMPISWENVKKHTQSTETESLTDHLKNCECREFHHKTLGRLCREFGHRNNAFYAGNGGTYAFGETSRKNLANILSEYNISPFEYFNSDCSNLSEILAGNNCVAYIEGFDPNIGGHAWVCDGVKVFHTIYNPKGAYTGIYYNIINRYYHFNWGFNGDHNGYFLASVFDWDKGEENPTRANCYSDAKFFIVSGNN